MTGPSIIALLANADAGTASGVLRDLLEPDRAIQLGQALLLLIVGWLVARTASLTAVRLFRARSSPQQRLLIRRGVAYTIMAVFLTAALEHAGFQLGVLLGAAGVLTVALGFAAQTSVSNIISGLFLLGERAFEVGDTVQVDQLVGVVLSIDWLSVKLRTFDNLYVRMPNEAILKARITNLTHFPIRRIDVPLRVPFAIDLDRFEKTLVAVAERAPLCLDEPAPALHVNPPNEDGHSVTFVAWCLGANILQARRQLVPAMIAALRDADMPLAHPRRTITLVNDPRAGDAAPVLDGGATP
ncbi:MAG: mechanosensitive ion channel family protein [Acidobacteriota bacterium]